MARTAYFDASAGDVITIGTVDGVDIAALRALLLAHGHILGLDTHSESEAALPMRDSVGNTRSWRVADDNTGTNAEFALCTGGPRSHSHGQGTLAVTGTTAATILTPKVDDYIEVLHANGDLTCDLIDGFCPFVMYDRYDGHGHTVAGVPANHTFPGMIPHKIGDAGRNWFYCFVGGAWGWYQMVTNTGVNPHTIAAPTLANYAAPPGAGVDDAGDPKFKITAATGNITLKGDVNDIGIAQFYADYIAHVHTPGGVSSVTPAAASWCRVGGVAVPVGYSGASASAYISAAAHDHVLTCGAPL